MKYKFKTGNKKEATTLIYSGDMRDCIIEMLSYCRNILSENDYEELYQIVEDNRLSYYMLENEMEWLRLE